MKKTIIFSSLFILFLASFLSAQAKIGFVDSNRAVMETDEGKAEIQKIQDWAKQQDDMLQSMRKELTDKQTQLRNQQNMLSEEKRTELLGQVDRLDTQIKRKTEDLKKEYAHRLDEFGAKMNKKITPLFNKYAKDNNYTLILYINPQVLAYYDESSDITADIIKLYNQSYPFSGSASK